jgi:putative PIN family toxin of toxin-antitoxin system
LPKSTPKSRRTGEKSARRRHKPPRLVLDTNVWISALLWTGPPNEILRVGEAKRIVLLASPSILEEAREVLSRSKFAARIAGLETSVGELVEALLTVVEVIEEPVVEPVIAADPDDDRVLACAVAGKARWIISGDAHLLALKRHKRIAILTPSQALLKLRRIHDQQANG